MTSYTNNPYHPFPLEMRGNHCQLIQGDDIIFIYIFHIEYNIERVAFDKERGIYDDTAVKKKLDKFSGFIDEKKLFFIYTLESYKLKKNLLPISDAWDFHGLTHDYEQHIFVDLNAIALYCQERWGITLENFVPISKTDIP